MRTLSFAVILALATGPACGAALLGSEFAQRLRASAIIESSGAPYAIHISRPDGGAPAFSDHGLLATFVANVHAGELGQIVNLHPCGQQMSVLKVGFELEC